MPRYDSVAARRLLWQSVREFCKAGRHIADTLLANDGLRAYLALSATGCFVNFRIAGKIYAAVCDTSPAGQGESFGLSRAGKFGVRGIWEKFDKSYSWRHLHAIRLVGPPECAD